MCSNGMDITLVVQEPATLTALLCSTSVLLAPVKQPHLHAHALHVVLTLCCRCRFMAAADCADEGSAQVAANPTFQTKVTY